MIGETVNNIKASFEKAKIFLQELYDNENIKDIRLEEINLDYNSDYEEIVVSFLLPNKNKEDTLNSLAVLAASQEKKYERVYKILMLNKNKEKIDSIKIYQK